MNIKTYINEEGIVFKNVLDFDPVHTFECGQCFRWNRDADGSYTGIASGRAVRVLKDHEDLVIRGAKSEDKEFWFKYFDLGTDYGKIKDKLSEDNILKEAIKLGSGIRILNQEPFEIIISFIISANNRIPMIKKAVERISMDFGEPVAFEGNTFYSFPAPERLASAMTEEIHGCGFRAPYIVETAKVIAREDVSVSKITGMSLSEAHNSLIRLKGIGPKVADCILLFSMGKSGAFPVDVWVKRIMQYFYMAPDVSLKKIREFGMEQFKDYAGYAQQYLFYYAREKKIGTE